MSPFERFLKVYEDKAGKKPKVMISETGINANTLQTHMKRGTVNMDTLVAIGKAYRDIRLEWLFLGEGDMYKSGGVKIAEATSRGLSRIADCLNVNPKMEAIDEIMSNIPTASQDDMHEVSPNDGVPYYDDEFGCGIDKCYRDNLYPDYYIRIKGMERATLFCNASGDSMSPLIDKGDVVALQRIDDCSYLPLGEVYAITTTTGIHTIKRLRKGTTSDSYILEPINPEYDSEEIPKGIIRDVFKVIGCLKKF